ncbi:N-acetylmuramic acid 6-phosphate etherase [Spiroplasma endosymbiont of Crioceris asparagi]|uniref:N-acetylmuramic acid 6-phosphate etherase n=1 Tax=Spiroplasma endosymbiont of Crioceris asparagi TaxID=3066286 RepID=UPI0030D3E684
MKKIDLKKIDTEQQNKNSRHLEEKSTLEILNIINQEDEIITKAIKEKLPKITSIIDEIVLKLEKGGRLFYVGAGTSGRLGVLDASEILPTFGVSDQIIGLIAGGDHALRFPIEGAEDDENIFIKELQKYNFNEKDCVIAIGASGRTPCCLGTLKYAHKIGAYSASLCMSQQNEFEKYTSNNITILVGPEVVMGSTRLKSGTATKMVLNMISTTLMIKLGKVYDNYMINLQLTNQKLINRATMILNSLFDLSFDEAMIILKKHHNNLNKAIEELKN